MAKEKSAGSNLDKEGTFDKARRYLSYITYGVLTIGAVLTAFASTVVLGKVLFGVGIGDLSTDKSVGQTISDWLKRRREKKNPRQR